MSNYHVEAVDKPAALTRRRRSSRCASSRSRACRAGSSCATPLGAGIGLWLLEVTAGTIGFAWPNLSGGFGAPIEIGDLETIKLQNSALPIDEGFPAYYPEARAFVILIDPGSSASWPARTRPATAPRSTSGRSTSAARTWAASRTRASRTSGSSARATARATTGSASRPTAPQFGPAPRGMDRFSIIVDGGRRADHQHRQDHPWPAAGRARPARAHPAPHADRLHLTP